MVEIKILNGTSSIGGNFIRIEDMDKALIFDQGIRFDLMNKYYSGFVTPRGIIELRELGILPKPDWYEESSNIYVSHMHLDHLGALSNIPFEITANIPSTTIYEDMEEKWRTSPSWLSLIPRKYYVKVKELKPLVTDENGVMAVPVSHSAYPAYALIYFGKDETVLYTGDFRIESFLNQEQSYELNKGNDLFNFLEENSDIKIDSLIIEGTNIGSDRIPIAPDEASKIIEKLIKNRKQVLATLHSLDIEYVYTLITIAEKMNLDVMIASTQTAKLLERIQKIPLKPKVIEEYVDYLTIFEKTSLESINERALILVSYREIVDFIKDLNFSGNLSKDCLAIISESEPQIEEASEYGVIANWFSKMLIEFYRIRVSGHYYPYQLKTILNKIKPRKCIKIIHTERPNLFQRFLEVIN
ncbi:MAG: hypothetical protein QXI49_07315 [Candidatus Methanomethylicaceae archaeon]